jgi:cytochrome c biogenesis protein CcdA/thiol-disulfide isomerase/thioredoxin
MFLLLGAFIAGLLTVVAPCVLPLLPIIIGGSVSGDTQDKRRPFIIAGSLAVSLILFTLLLKVTTLLINIPPRSITYFSGTIIILLGILTLFPLFYAKVMARIGFEKRSQQLLGKGFKNKNSLVGPIITGAALGPVFSSCSPVYAYILATVLPASFALAFSYIIAYVLGLSVVLLGIGYYGQRVVRKIKFASNPKGWFQRVVAILFIIVGLLIFTGYDKKVQTYVSAHTPFKFDELSAKLIPKDPKQETTSDTLNIKKPYDAPEFTGINAWINSSPLTMKELRGKVVLVDFWTYSCINCIRNNPYLEKWYETYKDQGFVIVGVHAPEFAFEKVLANVEQGVKDQKITYPVALDNDLDTWNAYSNRYWPAGYLIDANGKIRRTHFGEGNYQESEEAIRALLKEKGAKISDKAVVSGDVYVPITAQQTPETYLGLDRASNFVGNPYLGDAPTSTFNPAPKLGVNQWTLGGTWDVGNLLITARGNSTVTINTNAKEVYLVAGADTPMKVKVSLDGKPVSETDSPGEDITDSYFTVTTSRLYRIVTHPGFREGTVTVTVPNGVSLNAFTFGS